MSEILTAGRGFARMSALCLALLAASCGGGGGSSDAPASGNPATGNGVPNFTSTGSVSVAENTQGTIYTAAASDPDGDPVQLGIGGGADAALFTMSDGMLAFKQAPNFDRPVDAGADNVYDVTLTATDSKDTTGSMALQIRVTNEREGVEPRLVTTLGAGSVIAARSGQTGLFRVTRSGAAAFVDAGNGAASELGNVFLAQESGRVLAAADFNGYGVVMLDIDGRGIVLRTVVTPDARVKLSKTIDLAPAGGGQVRGSLQKAESGFLFAALGDPSGDFAQDAGQPLGKLYSISVDPCCGASLGRTYCFDAVPIGSGIRAPAGGGGYGGHIFLLDRGADVEEVSYFGDEWRPLNFGWPFFEADIERMGNAPSPLVGPSFRYRHGEGFFEGRGLTGGAIYTGSIGSLADMLVMTDESGKIFTQKASALGDGHLHGGPEMENRTADFAPLSGALEEPVAAVMDYNGRLLVLDADGELYAI